MPSRVYVAKPHKVHAEQFLAATVPWSAYICTAAAPKGVCTLAPMFPDWRPHVHGDGQVYEVHETDWITTSVAFPEQPPEVVTNAQFVELYGGPQAEETSGNVPGMD